RSPPPLSPSFFFQAEDGIRDRNVTGVQTCALPISCPADAIYVEGASNSDVLDADGESQRFRPGERYGRVYQINYLRCILCGLCRSEERRVGKDRRSAASPGRAWGYSA